MADEVESHFAIDKATISDTAQSKDMQLVEDFLEALFPGLPVFFMVARPTGSSHSNVETFCNGPLDTVGELLQMIGGSLRERTND